MKRILDIEVLRATAILYVVIAHASFVYRVTPAWLERIEKRLVFSGGVDLFFVISGFVIARNLLPRLRGKKDVFEFWRRRIYRLLPSAWLWAFISLGIIYVTRREVFTANISDVVAALLQVYNFHAYGCVYSLGVCGHQAVGVYWSLSLEEQFYLVLPVLLLFWPSPVLILALGLAGVVMTAVAPVFATLTRWDGFCWGVLLAWFYLSPLHALINDRLLVRLGAIRLAGAWLLAASIPVIGRGSIIPFVYPMLAIVSALLVLLASYDQNHFRLPSPLRGAAVYVGSRSYGIYLIHVPVFLVFNWLVNPSGMAQELGLLAFAVATVVALADLNFRLVESRFRLR
jgi:peptidoglycan/LPS O-acetylase OafA/YrhL